MPYFDSTATTKPDPEILELYQKLNNDYWYNVSSQYKTGVIGANLLEKATKQILTSLQIKDKKIIFTSGATEANNQAIYGICNRYLGQNKHIITTSVEHPSVLNCFKDLEQKGFKVTYLPINEQGVIDLSSFIQALTSDTILVSIMWVNNIIGSIMPIKNIIEEVKKYPRLKLHVDAVQGIGKITNDFNFNDIDLLTITSHKINGLKGTGALIINQNILLDSVIKGGHQQDNLRAGTIDLAGAVCLSQALKKAMIKQQEHYQHVNNLYQLLLEKLHSYSAIIINRSTQFYSPYILSITFKNIKAETVMHYFEKEGIYVGIGSACNEKTKRIEPTITYFQDPKMALNTIRISISFENTEEEIEQLVRNIKEIGNK